MILSVLVGLFAGAISVTTGGAALINIPFLLIIGLNPASAIATSKLSILSSLITGSVNYHRKNMVKEKRLIIFLSVATIIGSVIGANLVLSVNPGILRPIIIPLLVFVLLVSVFKKEVVEKVKKTTTTGTHIASFIIILILSIYGGFFGAGFGTFVMFSLIYLMGFTFLESSVIMTLINVISSLAAVGIFVYSGVIDYSFGIPLLIGTSLGGYVGSHFAIIKGSKLIKKFFVVVTSILIIKLIADMI